MQNLTTVKMMLQGGTIQAAVFDLDGTLYSSKAGMDAFSVLAFDEKVHKIPTLLSSDERKS